MEGARCAAGERPEEEEFSEDARLQELFDRGEEREEKKVIRMNERTLGGELRDRKQ